MNKADSSKQGAEVHRGQSRYRPPAAARQILLVRHASSVGVSVQSLKVGDLTVTDPPLSVDGIAQAQALATYLSAYEIAAIFTTPLQRTRQTAAPLAALLKLEPIVVEDLREVYLGDWEHNFYEYAASGHPNVRRMYVEETWDVIPNSERSTAFAERVRRGIVSVLETVPAGVTAVVFSHAATIAEICRQATASRAFAFMAPENTSVSRLIVHADGTWKLRSFNEMAHLGYC